MDHLQSMRVFVKVADLGSFVRAASAMDISNAVATRHIADLEGRLGTRLLNRTTRSLSLTESGQVYLERARQILDELEDVEQMVVARNHEPVGSLRIVAPVVFGLHNLAPVLQTYAERYPKVIPDVTLVDRQVDLVEEGFDVGIVIARQMRSASIVTRRLTTGCMTVCATPDLPRNARHADASRRSARASVPEPAVRIRGRRARVHRPGRRSARASVERDRREQYGNAAAIRAARHGHRDPAELSDRQRHDARQPRAAAWRLPAAAGRDQHRVSEPPPFAGEGADVHRPSRRTFQPDAESPARRAVAQGWPRQARIGRVER